MDTPDISLFRNSKKEKTEVADSSSISSNNSLVKDLEQNIILRPTEEDEYNCNNPNPGIALILNHKYIKDHSQRLGTEKDRDAVHAVLNKFGYDVRVYNDLTHDELKMVLRKTAKENHTDNDCLIVVVMTHGKEQKLFAHDKSYPVEEIWNPFLGENCKTLINKPKLFFIQACRGSKLEKPVRFVLDSVEDARVRSAAARPLLDVFIKPPVIMYAIPNTADLLIMYSTFEKHYSFRNTENGSWFIQSLCRVLRDAAEGPALSATGAELLGLLTAVNRKVAYEYQANSTNSVLNKMKSMPNFLSTLTKTFYLRIKTNRS